MYHYHRRTSKGKFGIFDIFMKKESRLHFIDALKYLKNMGSKLINIK